MIVSIQHFNDYSGNYEDSANAEAIKTMCLESAENVVKDYLRYDPIEQNYTEYLSGYGVKRVFFPARNVHNLTSIVIDEEEQDLDDFVVKDDCLIYADRKRRFWCEDEEIKVTFSAGWSEDNMPSLIKETILRIATLMLMEAGENIGVSSKSMPDNSRTFISYTNYNKYLQPLQNLRVVAF